MPPVVYHGNRETKITLKLVQSNGVDRECTDNKAYCSRLTTNPLASYFIMHGFIPIDSITDLVRERTSFEVLGDGQISIAGHAIGGFTGWDTTRFPAK